MRTIMLGLVVCLVGLVSPAHAAPPDPRAVNLRLSDMPTGFTLDGSVSRTNAQAAKVDAMTPAQEQRRGRILSNNVTFSRTALVGMFGVDSTVVLFTTPRTARDAYATAIKHGAGAKLLKPMSMDHVGDASIAWTTVTKSGGVSATVYISAFLQGRYIVQLVTYGATATFSADSLLTFARTLDARIKQHG